MTTKFTGRHMLAIMILFFGTVIAVNVTMARLAVSTFGGTVVDNSYVASQRFNGWIAAGRRQAGLGWTATLDRDAGGRPLLALAGPGGVLRGASVSAVAVHPFGHRDAHRLTFAPASRGYRARGALPQGRWRLAIDVRHAGRSARFVRELP